MTHVLGMAHLERRAKRVPVQGRTEKRMMGRIQNLQSCVCVFAPHVAFDHEIHVATSHAWVSSRFRGVLVCMTPRYVVSHTLLLRFAGGVRVAVARGPCACVSSRRHPLQIPPPQFRGSCQCVGGLVSFKSLSRGRVGGEEGPRSRMCGLVWLIHVYGNAWPNVINVL